MADKSGKQKLNSKRLHSVKGQMKNYQERRRKQDEEKEKQKRKAFHSYKKVKRTETAGLDVQKIYKELQSHEEESQSTSKPQVSSPHKRLEQKKAVSRFTKAQWEHQKKAEKEKQQFEEMQKRKQGKEEALQKYRSRKQDKFLKLCKRTPKGQPQMKYQMQYLLEQLEQQHKERPQASGSSS